ncbi:hypothetical protein IF128_09600 [Empedobacter stercoris]|uniref:Uncharacterized protein n=1 Tax=Empedobacter stercoris TaxID=1628248 RepID=A0ABX1WNL0_9FLAO|nr:hypothetical protein [Empedobacter stercoris]MCA4809994.1 hypothetical protein [Empedobacter stercoris]NOJ76256.1 hypothetical protein [Empedobacter stercoris]QNT13345.1 hypothetical protein HNV03_00850 [Empedobacter stercoris]
MKINKTKGFITSALSFIIGFVLNGLAWTVLPGPELNTISLIFGLLLMLLGFCLFVASFWFED